MTVEKTLIILKPDALQRGFAGRIVSRFEDKGFQILALKMMRVSRELAEKHYAVHQGKPFYPRLINYITSSPVIVMDTFFLPGLHYGFQGWPGGCSVADD